MGRGISGIVLESGTASASCQASVHKHIDASTTVAYLSAPVRCFRVGHHVSQLANCRFGVPRQHIAMQFYRHLSHSDDMFFARYVFNFSLPNFNITLFILGFMQLEMSDSQWRTS